MARHALSFFPGDEEQTPFSEVITEDKIIPLKKGEVTIDRIGDMFNHTVEKKLRPKK